VDRILISHKGRGLSANVEGIFPARNYFPMGNTVDLVHHPWTTEGAGSQWTGHGRLKGGSPELSLVAALGHGGPTAVAQRKEGCMGSPSRASPGRGRRCSDRATAVKKWQRRRSVRVALGCGENRRRAGRGTMENSGALPLYRGRGGGRRTVIKTEK
jgi:hypothetical protein